MIDFGAGGRLPVTSPKWRLRPPGRRYFQHRIGGRNTFAAFGAYGKDCDDEVGLSAR